MIHIMRCVQNLLLALLLLGGSTSWSAPVGTAFTYQGRLMDGINPATGQYDLHFNLFDGEMSAASLGPAVTNLNVAVSNGLFVVTLDFGATVLDGAALWLEIGVRTNGAVEFTDLTPRQPLTPTPYAIAAGKLTGPVSDALLSANVALRGGDQTFGGSNTFTGPNTFTHASNHFVGTFAGDGSGLSNLNVNASDLLGQLTDSQLPATIPRLAGDALFTGAVNFSNPSNRFTGHGGELSGLNPANFSSGTAAISITGNAETATSAAVAATAAVAYRFLDPLAGDVSGTQGATLVERIRGVEVAAVAPTTNQYLRYDGARWVPGHVALETDVTGSLPDSHLSANVGLLNADQTFTGFNAFTGVTDFSNGSNAFNGRFTGDGAGLSNLNVAQLVGMLPEPQLPPNVLRLDGNQILTGSLTFNPPSGAPFAVGSSSLVAGLNADLLDGLDSSHFAPAVHTHSAADLVSGTLPEERLAGVYSGVLQFPNAANSFAGAFSGDGSGLSNLFAGVLTGTVADTSLSPNIARLDAHQQLTGSNVFSGVTTVTNEANEFAGTFRGDGAGLINLASSNLVGTLQESQLPTSVSRLDANQSFIGLVTFGPASSPPFNVNSSEKVEGLNSDLFDGLDSGAFWKTTGNAGTSPEIYFLGTTDEQPLEFRVNGQRALRLEATMDSPNVIGGWFSNRVAAGVRGATITGGGAPETGANSILANFGTVAGGASATIDRDSDYSTIGGGVFNLIQTNAHFSNVGGGVANQVISQGWYATIGGGVGNMISGWRSATIGGGERNSILTNAQGATISGGIENRVLDGGHSSTIGGGAANTVLGGGFSDGATIGGGQNNTAAAFAATVAGGLDNVAEGPEATVPGGQSNTAAGWCSFAAGRRAKALHQSAFVWADISNFDFASTETNSFSVRSVGGVRFVSGVDDTGAPIAGVELPAGSGAWSSLSDRNSKENFVPVNSREVLEKVSQLPLSTWNYKSQDDAIRHIGPTAQDFAAAFQVGEDERRITTIDADGVALAAIQGLNSLLSEQKQELQQLRQQNQTLTSRLEELEKMVRVLAGSGVARR